MKLFQEHELTANFWGMEQFSQNTFLL